MTTAPPWRIDRFGAEAAAVLAGLHARCFAEAWSAEAFARLLSSPGCAALVARLDAAPAGFALYRVAADEAELLSLAVLPAARRRGLGRALLRAVQAQARARGAATLFLEVGAENRAAGALYRAAGFAVVGRRPGYYAAAGPAGDALLLRRALTEDDVKS